MTDLAPSSNFIKCSNPLFGGNSSKISSKTLLYFLRIGWISICVIYSCVIDSSRIIHWATHSPWLCRSILSILLHDTTFGESFVFPFNITSFPSCWKHISRFGLSMVNRPKEFIHGIPKMMSFCNLTTKKFLLIICSPILISN